MANHASALKRARQNETRRQRNRTTKTRVKHIVKIVQQEVAGKSADASRVKLNNAQAVIDKAAKKGVIHKKTAARKISRLTRRVNALPT